MRQLIADPSPLLLLPQRAFSSGHQRRMHAHQGAAALAAQQAGLVAAGPLLEMADAPELRALFQVVCEACVIWGYGLELWGSQLRVGAVAQLPD